MESRVRIAVLLAAGELFFKYFFSLLIKMLHIWPYSPIDPQIIFKEMHLSKDGCYSQSTGNRANREGDVLGPARNTLCGCVEGFIRSEGNDAGVSALRCLSDHGLMTFFTHKMNQKPRR